MSDISLSEAMPPAETGIPSTIDKANGGVNLDAQHDVTISGVVDLARTQAVCKGEK